MKRHPEDRIYDAKKFINELSKVQPLSLSLHVKKVNIKDERLKDFLFDYIYNEQEPICFCDYLRKYNICPPF
jgi:hypothetical protein